MLYPIGDQHRFTQLRCWRSVLIACVFAAALGAGLTFPLVAVADDTSAPANPSTSSTTTSDALTPGWSQRGSEWYYADEKGQPVTGWLSYQGKWYFLDKQGRMYTGLIDDGSGSRYFADESGAMIANSWGSLGQHWFYATSSGALVSDSWYEVNNRWYHFDKQAHMQTGIVKDGDKAAYYLDDSGAMQRGWASTSQGWVYADGSGALANSFVSVNGKWYCFDKETYLLKKWRFTHLDYPGKAFYSDGNGVMQVGWSETAEGWVYADGDGYLQTDWQSIDGSWYFFNDQYVMRTGIIQDKTGAWYCLGSDGAMARGWAHTDQEWVYAQSSGELFSGIHQIDGATYFFKTSGAPLMQTGVIEVSAKRYGAGPSGAFVANALVWSGSDAYGTNKDCEITTGWLKDSSGAYYYLDPAQQGRAVRGAHTVDGKRYFFDNTSRALAVNTVVQDGDKTWYANSSGELTLEIRKSTGGSYKAYDASGKPYPAGFIADTGNRMYVDADGSLHTGWLQQGSDWYYYDNQGMAVSGWKQLDGSWYYFNAVGKMQRGWVQDGSTYYHLASSGAMDTGWYQEGSSWYYLNKDGSMATGWLEQGGTWYYLTNSGAMAVGWEQVNGTWYYFYSNGSMATGWIKVDGNQYYLSANGAWISDVSDMTIRAQGYSSPTNYLIMVDVDNKYVGVYYGSAGAWNLEKRYRCSVGAPGHRTPRGTFDIKSRGYSFSNSWCTCYYYLQFYDDYLFHSPPELFTGGSLSAMGTEGSHGCVRVEKHNAKWMYETIPTGTTVVTY